MCRLLIISLIIFVAIHQSVGQSVDRSKLLVAYTYSFAKNIEWPADKNEYVFQIISSNSKVISEFRSLSETKRLKDQPITLIFSTSPVLSKNADIVFIGQEYNMAVRSILNQASGHSVLTITDKFEDDRFIMINFVESTDQTLSFQINRANIINQGLGILPDMVLLGGDEVDVAKLYREAQDSILAMEQRTAKMQERFDSLIVNVKRTTETIKRQSETIRRQTQEIKEKQFIVDWQESSLDSLRRESNNSESRLDSLVTHLNSVRSELDAVGSELNSQRESVRNGNEILAAQNELIDEREDQIKQREAELKEMESVVLSQKNMLFYLFILACVLILFFVITYRAYTARRKDARTLAIQKEELSSILGELREAQSQLVQSEKMASLGVLIAGIAHEINNAINFVYSGIHIIKSKFTELDPIIAQVNKLGESGDVNKRVKKIVKLKKELDYRDSQKLILDMVQNVQIGAERTIEIIKGLRTFSKTETEEKTKVNVHQDIEVALLLLESRYKNVIRIEKKFDSDVPEIDGYQGQLGQAFMNIIGNAIDALEGVEHPTIIIKTKRKKNHIEISIKDNGVGIEAEVADKIFDPFFTTKGIGTGTGLGLSITYGIMEKHEGKIKMKSSPGEGAEFILELPIR